MKDVNGFELKIGDEVVTTYVYRNKGAYTSHNATNLAKATVIGFSKLKIRLEVDNPKTGTKEITTKYSDQVSKIYQDNPLQQGLDHAQNLGIPADEMLEILQELNQQLLDMDY